jgi:hypothetical protein
MWSGATSIEFSTNGTQLYGFAGDGGSVLYHFNVNSNGITLASGMELSLGNYADFRCSAGRLFASNGSVYDPETGVPIGFGYFQKLPALDPALGLALFSHTGAVQVLRTRDLVRTGSIAVNGYPAGTNVTRWGDDGVAYSSGSWLVLVRSQLITDTDLDGMPDAWERIHFPGLDPASIAPGDDPDGDGFTSLAEWQAGTNPHDPDSSLRLGPARLDGGDAVLRFATVAGRRYSVQASANPNGGWLTIAQDIIGTGGNIFLNDPAVVSAPHRFYRLMLAP